MPKRFQLFYLARDKSREFSVCYYAKGFNDAKDFFEQYFAVEGLELVRIKELP